MAFATVYHIPGHKRSTLIGAAMAEGIGRAGQQARLIPSSDFREPVGDVAVFYGFNEAMQGIFRAYRAAGKPVVYIDLGYWGRKDSARYTGFHKIAVNNRHPTPYFNKRSHPGDRFARFNLTFKDWRDGSFILLAGASDRCAAVDGFNPEEWERKTIETLRRYTDRPIVYRPKPSWRGAQPIPGTEYSIGGDIKDALVGCHAVVTHHSNVSVDGFLEGVPSFCEAGVALPLALTNLSQIEKPLRSHDRAQWAANVAWTQFDVEEMKTGAPWRHLLDEGLIP